MKLVLYSDQSIEANKKVDIELLKLINKEKPHIGYIASGSDITRTYFNLKVEYYRNLGVDNILYFDLDVEFDESKIEDLFNCDAIHLPGGNTYWFLYNLKKRNFISKLQQFVSMGKVLIGISAGSILMSKNIDIAQFEDENVVSLKDTTSLGLVDFEFLPHWNMYSSCLEDLKKYSLEKNNVIYACKDGDGIVVENNEIRFYGDIIKIINGSIV